MYFKALFLFILNEESVDCEQTSETFTIKMQLEYFNKSMDLRLSMLNAICFYILEDKYKINKILLKITRI